MIKRIIKKIFYQIGFEIHKKGTVQEFPIDFDNITTKIIKSTKPFTLTSKERNFALIEAVKYVINHEIAGDIVECGVWKGGSVMIICKTLIKYFFRYAKGNGMVIFYIVNANVKT